MELLVRFLSVLIVGIVVGAIVSYPAMLLWNSCLVPAIPGIKEVAWLQVWGIMVMGQLMFQTKIGLNEPRK